MHSQIKLGRIAGISIGLHYSWFLIVALIVFSLVDHFQRVAPHWSNSVVWSLAAVTGLLFFATLLLHELAHSVVAQARGIRVRAITLFALGGMSQIESDASDAASEFWIAVAGPLTSLILGLGFLFGARAAGWLPGTEPPTPAVAVLLWLGYINISLAAFNMIPGYPLDGGRVLRAIVWWITKDRDRSTRVAARIGQVVAFILILFGLMRFFQGANFGGLWLAFIGWFLLDASGSTYVHHGLMEELRGRRVAELMDSDCPTVDGHFTLQDFVDRYLLRSEHHCFIVLQNNTPAGLITLTEVKKVARNRWSQTSVQSIMRPLGEFHPLTPETPAARAVEMMTREDQLPIVSNGRLLGVLSRGQLLRFLQAKRELYSR